MPWEMITILIALVGVLFICVLMHEFGHALMARRFGIGTHDIMITPIGGLARLDRMSSDPIQELLITLAGPLVNLGLAIVLAGIVYFSGATLSLETRFHWNQFAGILMWMNLALFTFNLIPAFPMDGGRVLRSCLAMVMSHYSATMIAGAIGMSLAIAFAGYAIITKQYLLVAVGAFVFYAAWMEVRYCRYIHRVRDLAEDSR